MNQQNSSKVVLAIILGLATLSAGLYINKLNSMISQSTEDLINLWDYM